ncbi:NAD(P)/FAD-dependent oxidoreductase [Plantactinospora sp. KBS50]|uniref:NAD(P)/FAD-dependent oxidoreductase n=1 Tax=Plantactinospora sp. KBS50 TaxID=2024580 RepID=UPI000BAADD98|nr:FAD-dependent oxidoreductase [Plantactinospora sp. KBS50]ASW54563.1 NAD/FAD-dependent oxidoreductase [Plantactinospora sp. KBS50]
MLVVGAGIAGVSCARELAAAGVPVRIRERARVPGGRMASRRFDGRPADLGAAYFTVSDPDFAAVVRRWAAAGLAREWTDTFVAYDATGRTERPGPVRWAAPGGLRSLVTQLAGGLDVTTDRLVTMVEPGPLVDSEPVEAVVLAMPGPQAARLLDTPLAAAVRATRARRWAPSLAAVLRYPRRSWVDFAGAFVNDHPVLATVCDDGDRRGDRAPVLVAHTTAEFAGRYLPQPSLAGPEIDRAVRDLLALPDPAAEVFVHRWTYARPEPAAAADPEAADPAAADAAVTDAAVTDAAVTDPGAADSGGAGYHLDDDGIGLAGDAFGTPKVQTAWCSGRALGRALAARLR